MKKYAYSIQIQFEDPKAPAFTDPQIAEAIRCAIDYYNAKSLIATNPKSIISCSNFDHTLELTLESEAPLPFPGKALQVFSRFLAKESFSPYIYGHSLFKMSAKEINDVAETSSSELSLRQNNNGKEKVKSMILNLMTYNIEGWIESNKEPNKLVPREIQKALFEYIDNYLKDYANAIVVLQEVIFDRKSRTWQEINKIVNDNSSEIFYHTNTNALSGTVIISKLTEKSATISSKGIYCPTKSDPNAKNYRNKKVYVEIQYGAKNLSILGMHLTEKDKDNDGFIEQLLSLDHLTFDIMKPNDIIKPDIILGDFNAGDYLECKSRDTYNSILKEDYVCICNIPTRIIAQKYGTRGGEKTCIDHIFVNIEKITNCSSLIVHEEISFSDHYPITFKIEL